MVLPAASSFDSEDSTTCFPSWVRSVPLWPEVAWKQCGRLYENSVVHMMNGRAYARSIRAHFIAQSELSILLLESSTVEESLEKDIETCFMSLHA